MMLRSLNRTFLSRPMMKMDVGQEAKRYKHAGRIKVYLRILMKKKKHILAHLTGSVNPDPYSLGLP